MDQTTIVSEALDEWVADAKHSGQELERVLRDGGHAELLPLDGSYESLDRLEHFLLLILNENLPIPIARDRFRSLVVQYVGEVVRTKIGGTWTLSEGDSEAALCKVGSFSDEFVFFPSRTVSAFSQSRISGFLRGEVEKLDLGLTEVRFRQFLQALPANLARCRQVLERRGVNPGLDLVALRELEALVLAAPPPETQELADAAVAYIGEVIRHLGHGSWLYLVDPMDVNFGEFCVGKIEGANPLATWSPRRAWLSFIDAPAKDRLVQYCLSAIPRKKREALLNPQ